MNDRLRNLIERNSVNPMVELLKVKAYLSFDEEKYGNDYCERYCPNKYAEYEWECPGGCRTWDEGMRDGQRKVYGADMLIETVLREGYQVLGVSGLNEPSKTEEREYADIYWDEAYNSEEGICAGCKLFGKSECLEDIFSTKCVRSGDAFAVERITDAVNEVLVCSL